TFGFSDQAVFRATQVQASAGLGSAFRLTSPEGEGQFTLPLPGRHNIQNALAAIATASLWAIPPDEVRRTLAEFQNLHQRCEILTLPGRVTLINDCYNSNPLAMERMLEALAVWPGASRRLVIAGEMLEL